MTSIKPLGNRVLIKRETTASTTAGGIVLPDCAQEKTQYGVIIEIGTDHKGTNVMPGDRVLLAKYGGVEVNIGGELHLLIDEADLLGIVAADGSRLFPTHANVLVRMRSRQDTTKGGIALPEFSKQTEEWGQVEEVGRDTSLHIKPGDLVYVGKTQGTHYKANGVDYILLDEPRIQARLDDLSIDTLEVGDSVWLRSGGPEMSVHSANRARMEVRCIWNDDSGNEQRSIFPIDALTSFNPNGQEA